VASGCKSDLVLRFFASDGISGPKWRSDCDDQKEIALAFNDGRILRRAFVFECVAKAVEEGTSVTFEDDDVEVGAGEAFRTSRTNFISVS
jgi:hypothetical protein